MATLSAIRAGLESNLATITGLRCYDRWPSRFNTPAAVVQPMTGDFASAGPVTMWTFEIVLAIAKVGSGSPEANQAALDAYLDMSGSSSVRVAVEGDNRLGGIVSSVYCAGWRDYGEVTVDGVQYWGVAFDVNVCG